MFEGRGITLKRIVGHFIESRSSDILFQIIVGLRCLKVRGITLKRSRHFTGPTSNGPSHSYDP